MGAKKGLKSSSVAFHPNSRKAGQVIKRLAHDNRVSASKKLKDLKNAAFRSQVEWFQNEIDKWTGVLCPHEFDALIEKYILRNDEEIERLESSGRSTKDSFRVDEMRRRAANEAEKYSTSGLVVPNLLCIKGSSAVRNWGSDVIDLAKIPTKKFVKSGLTTLTIGTTCKTALSCPELKVSNGVEVDQMN